MDRKHQIENRLAALEKVREELRAKTKEANYLRKDLDTVRAENDRLTSVLAPRVETAESLARKAQEELRRVGSLQQEPVVVDGQLAVGWRMRVTMSCDHRVIDGASAAEYPTTLRGLLENPVGLLV